MTKYDIRMIETCIALLRYARDKVEQLQFNPAIRLATKNNDTFAWLEEAVEDIKTAEKELHDVIDFISD